MVRRQTHPAESPAATRALIYSLSLVVYCTSWTYYGAVGKASTTGWEFFSIYLGPILVVVFGYRFLKKVATICREQNITTIADFISSRYGKSGNPAVLVTVIAILGTMPYIALQLQVVALSYEVLAHDGIIINPEKFVPPIIGGIFWKGASRAGAFAGLGGGFLCWVYTLLLPSICAFRLAF